MRIFSKTPNFDFVGKRKIAMFISAIVFIGAITSLSINWLNLGLDFRGGIEIELGYTERVKVDTIRQTLASNGYQDAVVSEIDDSGQNITIRISEKDNASKVELTNEVVTILRTANDSKTFDIRRREFVGAKIGEELREDGGIAMLIALAGIMLYVMLRFEWRFSLGAITALVHDVGITLGFFSFFKINFDLTVLAALLAVIGYSLNDTIVVYDRIRENFRKIRKGSAIQVTNTSLNQTISRTMMTSVTTLFVLLAMYFFGGENIRPFAVALIIGVVVGTYSSIYVASSMVLALKVQRTHLMPATKESREDSHP